MAKAMKPADKEALKQKEKDAKGMKSKKKPPFAKKK